MQSTGIVRKLDSLGRITLPMELRKSFDQLSLQEYACELKKVIYRVH